VTAPELEMAVAFPGVVDRIPVCDFGEEGTGVGGEGVEVETVDC
jgi:hypothetical protein